jgi:L-rhamnose mutarotase
MLQVQCVKIPVLDGKVTQLRGWIEGLSARRPEVLEAITSEGIADETVFLGVEGDRSFLYLYSRATSFAAAAAAFEVSELAVDVEFKRLMAECLDMESAEPLILLFAADRERGWVRS